MKWGGGGGGYIWWSGGGMFSEVDSAYLVEWRGHV